MEGKLAVPPPGFDELSADEQLDYIQRLWDRVTASPESISVPEWHRRTIEERLAAAAGGPETTQPWDQVRDRIAAGLAERRHEL